MNIIWKEIEGFEGLYMISSIGQILNIKRNKIKKPTMDSDGYLRINLWRNNKKYPYRAHRLVASAFIPNEYSLPTVNHKNGIKHDNIVDNLEWMGVSENTIHAHLMGLYNIKGEGNGSCKLTEQQVIKIKKSPLRSSFLANIYGVNESSIRSIKKGRTWKHLITPNKISQ